MVKIDLNGCNSFVKSSDYKTYEAKALAAFDTLVAGNGKGNDFLGWLTLPLDMKESELAEYEQICATIKNMIGNITGMVCDGAKVGCALKVASGVSSAVQACELALAGHCVSRRDGIIDDDIERSIRNLGRVGSVGMHETDNVILDIMVCK